MNVLIDIDRWQGSFDLISDKGTIYFSGTSDSDKMDHASQHFALKEIKL